MHAHYDHEQLIDYIEGELPAEQMARVDAMLASDPKLRRLIESIKADRKALRAMPPDEAPRALVDDVMAGLERQMLLGEAPTDGDDVDEIAAEAQRNRMRIGPRLLRVASYTGLAAALAIAGGVVFLTVTDSPLLEQADPQKWGGTFDNRSVASRDAVGRGDTGTGRDALTLRDMDAMSKSGPSRAVGKAGEAGSKLDGSSMAMGKPGGVPAAPGAGVADAGQTARRFAKGGATPRNGEAQARHADAAAPDRTLHPLLNAAQTTGNQGPFALRLPEPDEANLVIEVVSDDVDDTTAGLNQWLVSNGAQIVPAEMAFGRGKASVGSLKDAARRRNAAVGEPDDSLTRQSAYGVVINDDQVPELLAYMNRSRAGRQVARLVESAQPQRVALLQEEDAGERYRYGGPAYDPETRTPAPSPAEATPPAAEPAEGLASKMAQRATAEATDESRLAKKTEADQLDETPAVTDEAREPEAIRALKAPSDEHRQHARTADRAEGAPPREAVDAAPTEKTPAKAEAPAGAELADQQAAQEQAPVESRPRSPRAQPQPTPEAESAVDAAPDPATEPILPNQPAESAPRALAEQKAGGRKPDALSEATERQLSEQVSTFDWGAVLGNQLPLAKSTPLSLARRGRVVLPLVITESRTLDAAASLREAATESDAKVPTTTQAKDVGVGAGDDAGGETGAKAEATSGADSGRNPGGANQSLEVPGESDAAD